VDLPARAVGAHRRGHDRVTSKHAPRWHAVSISGYTSARRARPPSKELAFTLADGIGYVDAA